MNEGIMEEQQDKKIMMMATLSVVVFGGVYYFLYNLNIRESTVLTTKESMHLVFTYIQIIFIIMMYYLGGTLSIILIREREYCYIIFKCEK
ncbi:hypothetical protein bcgnr5380_08570 [Bacillus cereus]